MNFGMSTGDYFPYHPLRWRLTLAIAASGALLLLGWAVWGFAHHGGFAELARAALSLGLLLAMASMAFRLRPREGWGVKVGPTMLSVARATQGSIDIPWSAVREVRRLGKRRDTLVLMLNDDRRVLVPRHLFSRQTVFEALASAIEDKMPPLPYDA